MLYVVGIGPGNRDYILPKAIEVLKKCDLILGFARVMESIDFIDNNKIIVKTLREIIDIANDNKDKNISVIASGDPTFFGISNYLGSNYIDGINVIPGISSFQYLTCKLNKPWNNAYTGSLHGRDDEFVKVIKEKNISIWLTDSKNSPYRLCELLLESSIDCKVYVGENLSYDNERLLIGIPQDILKSYKEDKNPIYKNAVSVMIVER